MSKRVEYPLTWDGREAYYAAFAKAAEMQKMELNRHNFDPITLHKKRENPRQDLKDSEIVGLVESDSPIGELFDASNEITPAGMNKRRYDGIEIRIVNRGFQERIENLAKVMRYLTGEDVKFYLSSREPIKLIECPDLYKSHVRTERTITPQV